MAVLQLARALLVPCPVSMCGVNKSQLYCPARNWAIFQLRMCMYIAPASVILQRAVYGCPAMPLTQCMP